jgi:holliday junction DNA helicase RuvA
MISLVRGTLTVRDIDRVEVLTAGGVGYDIHIPLSVYESLPRTGEEITLHTALVVKEDGWQLFGFSAPYERRIFQKLLTASGIGPALAIGLLSALSAPRLVRAIIEKDIATLQSVPRVGRKKAERMVLELADKLEEVGAGDTGGMTAARGSAADDSIRALVSLGYSQADAERGVKAALPNLAANAPAPDVIRAALAKLGGR